MGPETSNVSGPRTWVQGVETPTFGGGGRGETVVRGGVTGGVDRCVSTHGGLIGVVVVGGGCGRWCQWDDRGEGCERGGQGVAWVDGWLNRGRLSVA